MGPPQELLGRLVTLYSKYLKDKLGKGEESWKLSIILPLALPLGCVTWANISDLSKHTLVTNKWGDITINKTLISPLAKSSYPNNMPLTSPGHIWP